MGWVRDRHFDPSLAPMSQTPLDISGKLPPPPPADAEEEEEEAEEPTLVKNPKTRSKKVFPIPKSHLE